MRNYELAYIADPDLDEQALKGLQEKIENLITAEGGLVIKVDRWGRRRMAYQINKKNDGYYTFIKTQLPASAGKVLEQNLRISEDVMRFMLILEEVEADSKAEAKIEAKAEVEAEVNTEAKAEVNAEATAEVEAEVKAEVEAEAHAEVEAEAHAEVEAEAHAEVEAEANAEIEAEADVSVEEPVEE